ncbi:MotA/TolQ/ExbB proton channel family protein [Sulfurimonas lithotrophica]|uniref:MotA/TolQ/ExbB proton channel family protein n=1 Tax=Sulfurimonas lithotrophica TaxID=2590022 RepID=A0A5P8P197_9BACT|nr:MotA/TolQ/ExbB proton channel family protein [Sulfurimonas lithotrophica]QFR49502.1 MotA/TolQ/ExbB proton channel family protein [Sulfurimonas lithotrophica]
MSILEIWTEHDWVVKTLIIAFSIVILMSLEKVYHYILYYKHNKQLDELTSLNELENLDDGMVKKTLQDIKDYPHDSSSFLNSYIGVKLDLYEQYMMKYVSIIGVIAVLSPMLGLIGTFIGVWHVFEGVADISLSDPSIIAGGIKEVIVDTMSGLIVAVGSMILYKTFEYISMKNVSKFEEKLYKLVKDA